MTINVKKTGQHHVRIIKREQSTPTHFINAIAFTWAGVTRRYTVTITHKAHRCIDWAEFRQR